ncbi:MAG: hemerythrin domain-containing protein [Alphaproteobacteria bacterium]|nr:hemerythrin domain-containing protein [Alphaproteobacteria bacterium]
MNFSSRTAQLLHEDHQATIQVVEALEQVIARAKRLAPDVQDSAVHRALDLAANAIEHEIKTHFTFEETELFTRLEEAGDVGIGQHLRSEHEAILPLGLRVAALAKSALAEGFSDANWPEFKSTSAELIERMYSHIQKEEMALLPMLDDLLDAETDMELAESYSNTL